MTEDILPLEQEPDVRELIARALAEDIGSGDATTLALVDAESTASARIVARHEVVPAGVGIAGEVFRMADPACRSNCCAPTASRWAPERRCCA
jgi:nicotinate-nucleotide pyrophosphorylase